jgi:hypothetical protein
VCAPRCTDGKVTSECPPSFDCKPSGGLSYCFKQQG